MNRTRLIFYSALAVCLVILGFSLAGQLISETRLLQLFVACTIFAGGVVLLDFFGILGHHDGDFAGHDLGGGHDVAVGDGGGHGMVDHAAGDTGLAGHGVAEHVAAPHVGESAAGHAVSGAHGDETGGGHTAHEADHNASHEPQPESQAAAAHAAVPHAVVTGQINPAPLLSVLVYLRLLVYFCLGFGPAGWVALAARWGAWRSLALAVPVGLASLFLARAFFRFQRRDTGAVAPEQSLLNEEAEVIVPLDARTMGKVRVRAGMEVTDLYALSADPGRAYEHGETVRIVRVDDDCVHVR